MEGVFKDTLRYIRVIALTDESNRTKQQPQKKSNQMGQTISIFELVVISVAIIVLYAFIKTLFQTFKSK